MRQMSGWQSWKALVVVGGGCRIMKVGRIEMVVAQFIRACMQANEDS